MKKWHPDSGQNDFVGDNFGIHVPLWALLLMVAIEVALVVWIYR